MAHVSLQLTAFDQLNILFNKEMYAIYKYNVNLLSHLTRIFLLDFSAITGPKNRFLEYGYHQSKRGFGFIIYIITLYEKP